MNILKKIIQGIKSEYLLNFLVRAFKSLLRRIRGFFIIGPGSTIGWGLELIGTKHIQFGTNIGLGNSSRIEAFSSYLSKNFSPKILIDNDCNFGNNLHIGAIGEIIIKSGVLGGSNILIIDHNHGDTLNLSEISSTRPSQRELISTGNIYIGENVWLADNVKILGGSVIESGSIIAANAIVKGRVKSNTIHYGHK